jgi:divalent metal cation (Fe/Co/Zn/Cd) transporter
VSGTFELPIAHVPAHDAGWLRAARLARLLAWASLGWMAVEGAVGVVAGLQADSISVLTWAAGSVVEGLASVIVVWRFTGRRTLSAASERKAQQWVGGSFFLLAPFFLYEAIHRLVTADAHAETTALAVGLTASSVVLMPVLGWAKLRLGRRLDSGATAGEGVQNLLCAGQALAALIAVSAAGAGLGIVDPIAAILIAGVAAWEGAALWRGEDPCACC